MSEMFPQHPKSGFYYSEKGPMLAPHLQMGMESSAMGDSRHQAPTMSPSWDSTIVVNTPLTSQVDTYNSSHPNH